jgi:hypothetical protein
MKRAIVLITVFLLAGAIVNVAVAWGCALLIRFTQPCTVYVRSNLLPRETYRHCLFTHEAFGSARLTTEMFYEKELRTINTPIFVSDQPLFWWRATPIEGESNEFLIEEARGWPMLSFRCRSYHGFTDADKLKTAIAFGTHSREMKFPKSNTYTVNEK